MELTWSCSEAALFLVCPQRAQAEPNSYSTNTDSAVFLSHNHKPELCVGLPWGSPTPLHYKWVQLPDPHSLKLVNEPADGFLGFLVE